MYYRSVSFSIHTSSDSVPTTTDLGAPGLRLEEDGLPVLAGRTGVVLGPRQRRVRDDVGHDLRQLAAGRGHRSGQVRSARQGALTLRQSPTLQTRKDVL